MLSIFRHKRDYITLGTIVNPFHLPIPFRLSNHTRKTHVYCCAKSGYGKSKLILRAFKSDIYQGNGCALIDPHGDLAQETISHLYHNGYFENEDQAERIVYINPAEYVPEFNVLKCSDNSNQKEIHELAAYVIQVMMRAWRDNLKSAPNFQDIITNSLVLLIKAKRPLTDLPRLFSQDKNFLDDLLELVSDDLLTSFFADRLEGLGARTRAEKAESTLNKINQLRNNIYLYLALSQKGNQIKFRDWMDDPTGKVVILDLGQLEDETQQVWANFFTHGFERAAFSRYTTPQSQRRPFYLYIDECQDVAATSATAYSRILSGTRKHGLHVWLSNQQLGQLKDGLLEAIFGNTSTKIFMNLSELDSLFLAPALGLGMTNPYEEKRESQTEIQHPVYKSTQEQDRELAAELATQKVATALVRDHRGRVFKIKAAHIKDSDRLPKEIFESAVKPLGISFAEAERRIAS